MWPLTCCLSRPATNHDDDDAQEDTRHSLYEADVACDPESTTVSQAAEASVASGMNLDMVLQPLDAAHRQQHQKSYEGQKHAYNVIVQTKELTHAHSRPFSVAEQAAVAVDTSSSRSTLLLSSQMPSTARTLGLQTRHQQGFSRDLLSQSHHFQQHQTHSSAALMRHAGLILTRNLSGLRESKDLDSHVSRQNPLAAPIIIGSLNQFQGGQQGPLSGTQDTLPDVTHSVDSSGRGLINNLHGDWQDPTAEQIRGSAGEHSSVGSVNRFSYTWQHNSGGVNGGAGGGGRHSHRHQHIAPLISRGHYASFTAGGARGGTFLGASARVSSLSPARWAPAPAALSPLALASRSPLSDGLATAPIGQPPEESSSTPNNAIATHRSYVSSSAMARDSSTSQRLSGSASRLSRPSSASLPFRSVIGGHSAHLSAAVAAAAGAAGASGSGRLGSSAYVRSTLFSQHRYLTTGRDPTRGSPPVSSQMSGSMPFHTRPASFSAALFPGRGSLLAGEGRFSPSAAVGIQELGSSVDQVPLSFLLGSE